MVDILLSVPFGIHGVRGCLYQIIRIKAVVVGSGNTSSNDVYNWEGYICSFRYKFRYTKRPRQTLPGSACGIEAFRKRPCS
jgi:hypothetical protein